MKLVCEICKQGIATSLPNEQDAIKDLVSLLKSHVKHKHKDKEKEYTEHLEELITGFKSVPLFLFMGYFVDLENPETSDRIGVMADELASEIDSLNDLFEGESEEIEEDGEEVINGGEEEKEVVETEIL